MEQSRMGSKLVWALATLTIVRLTDAATVRVSNCDGYSSPSGCVKGVNCAFEASWRVYDAGPVPAEANSNNTLAAVFTVTIRRAHEKSANFYTALGFSEHMAMPDTDVIIGYAYNNNFLEVVDAYIEPGQIKAPIIDQRQDVFNYNGSLTNDPNDKTKRVLTFSFIRRLDTGDRAQDIALSQCRYFFFVTGGGSLLSGPRQFGKHDVTPDMSSEKICLAKCLSSQHQSTVGGTAGRCTGSLSWLALVIVMAAFVRN